MRFTFPGLGEQTTPYCNTVTGALFCDCGHIEPVFYHCNRWECPQDYYYTAIRAANRIEDRLNGCREAFSRYGRKLGKPNHVIFSPPQVLESDFDLKKMWNHAKSHAKKIGFLAGVMAFHAFRIKEKYKAPLFKALKSRTDLKGGIWRGIHENLLGLPSKTDYVYFSPHFHIIGFFPKTVMKSNVFFSVTGWTYKNVLVVDRSIFKTARYILTHHHFESGKQSFTYFGLASPNKLGRAVSEKILTYLHCDCGQKLKKLHCYEEQIEQFLTGARKPESDRLAVYWSRVVRYYPRHTKQLNLGELPPNLPTA